MTKRKSDFTLPSYDDIFTTQEMRDDAKLEKVQNIPLAELHPFKDHPFKILNNEEMERMIESIRKVGAITPALARPMPDGGYELISGHRRLAACQVLGIETMPVIVREMSDDEAVIAMVDANLQRETILPSEKAFAYKMKLDALNHQGITSVQVGQKLLSRSIVAADAKTSETQIQRYIRLTYLIPELLTMVDENKIAFSPAVEISYARVIYLKDYASYIKDNMISELTELNRNMMLSIDVIPVPTDEAVREVERRLLGVETNIANWQRRQNNNNNFSAVVPYDMEQQRKESKEFLDDLTMRDQRMMFAVITMVHTADTKEQLDNDTEAILATARKHMCQLATLKFQQFDGLNTVLPIGTRKIDAFRTLTTESLAVFMPFKVQEIMDKGGIYYGQNAISNNLILCNIANLLNQSSWLLGVPGSGKSFFAKQIIISLLLNSQDDVMICDPEGEYAAVVEALMGNDSAIIRVAAGGADRLNAMYMVDGYGENDPIIIKSQFIMSLIEQIDSKGVGPQQKSIIDRCTSAVYREAAQTGRIPTLCTLRDKLLQQPEPEAKQIALSLELFTTGSLDIFGHGSTVDLDKRAVVFDIHGLGEQLKPAGLLVITDTILNRVTLNWKLGKRTHIFIDEFHIVFENEFSASFFNSAWRQFRKRNAYPTAITQNVEYLLDSVQASTMLSNSEFVVMLNQAASDREKLARLLNISNEQLSYITNADAGSGLIKYGSALVPFVNRFPKDTKLYQLMTTRPGEGAFSGWAS